MTTAVYRPGERPLVAVEHCIALFPAGAQAAATALWSCADEVTDVLRLLGALGASDLAHLPDFAVALLDEEAVHVVARGPFAVEVSVAGTTESWDGRDVATWAERRVRRLDVERVVLRPTGSADAADQLLLPLRAGVVMASSVELQLLADGAVTPLRAAAGPAVVPAAPESEPAPDVDAAPAGPTEVESRAEPIAAGEPGIGGQVETHEEWPVALQVAPQVKPQAEPQVEPHEEAPADPEPPTHAEGVTLVEHDDPSLDVLFGETIARSPEDAAIRAVDEVPVLITHVPEAASAMPTDQAQLGVEGDRSEAPGDHDGWTVARSSLQGAGSSAPVVPTAIPPTLGFAPVAVLAFSTGQRVAVRGPVLVGRAPEALNTPLSAVPEVVAVNSPTLGVSRTHLEVDVEDGKVVVCDVSSNGTMLTRPGQAPERLPERVRVLVKVGSLLELGDGVRIRVEDEEA